MPRYSDDLRRLVIEGRNDGLSYSELAGRFKMSKAGARKICVKYDTTGFIVNMPKTGRPRKTSQRTDKRIVREIAKNPLGTARTIKETLELDVSTRTINRRLKSGGLESRLQIRKPFLTAAHKKRLEFAKKYINKGAGFWNSILWSDESKFELIGSDKRRRTWQKPDEKFKEKNLCKTVKHGGGSILV